LNDSTINGEIKNNLWLMETTRKSGSGSVNRLPSRKIRKNY
jgi:hypothetical protein